MKTRLDVALFERGLAKSREEAHALVLAGQVYLGEVKAEKAGQFVTEETLIIVRGDTCPFASRGGYKLQKAMETFPITLDGKVCADIGASTGGFTDCMLQKGARKVFAIDVGYGQLDWKLRQDPRVAVMERTNARALLPEQFPDHPTLTVMDVSFISIKLVLPAAAAIMGEAGRFLTLVKPQFEAGRGQVGKNGVVREPGTHERVLREIRDFCPVIGWSVRGFTWSPIKGPKGNIEFLADIRPGAAEPLSDEVITALVSEAHMALRGAEEV